MFTEYVRFLSATNPIRWLNSLVPGEPSPYQYAGFVLLLCYLSICYFGVMRATRGRQGQTTLRSILIWVAIFSLPLLVAPEMFSSDVYAYIMYGRIGVVYGANPMTVPPLAFPADPLLQYMRGWQDVTASSYGPAWLMFSHGLTLLVHLFGQTPQLYLLVYKLAAIGLHMANAALIWQILGRWKPEQQAAGTLLYAWNPLALMEFAGSAHNDTLSIFFLLLALWAAQQNHWRRAVAGLSLSALAKIVPAILLLPYAVFLARQRASWKARLLIVGQAAGISVLLAVILYAPYWEGNRTLDAIKAQPDLSGTVNTIGDWAVHLLPRVTRAVSSGEDSSSVIGEQDTPMRAALQHRTAHWRRDFQLFRPLVRLVVAADTPADGQSLVR